MKTSEITETILKTYSNHLRTIALLKNDKNVKDYCEALDVYRVFPTEEKRFIRYC